MNRCGSHCVRQISQLLKVFSHLWKQESNQANKNTKPRVEEGLSRIEKGREQKIFRKFYSLKLNICMCENISDTINLCK